MVGVERADLDAIGLEIQRAGRGRPRLDQIPHHLVLAVHGDGFTAGQLGEIDPVPASLETEVEAWVA